jgi:small subunit ribosomal protein S8
MSVTDPIADMLTMIRNAVRAKKRWVVFPASNVRRSILEVLVRERYVRSYEVLARQPQDDLKVYLRYDRDNQSVITDLKRVSKPGRRTYVKRNEIPRVLGGLGTAVLSTPTGLLTDKEARAKGTGGEWVCNIW